MAYNILQLSQFPQYKVFVSLYKGVTNHADIRDSIKSGSLPDDFDFAFLNAANLLSMEQLYSALFRCFVDKRNGKMKANTIHTELISDLSPVKNIMEALTRFGIPAEGEKSDLIILKVIESTTSPEKAQLDQVYDTVSKVVQNNGVAGVCLTDAALESTVDLQSIRKNYKLGDMFTEDRERLNRLIIGTIQLRGL
ncbi:hypothetical protein FOA43_002489 [Brettanomyces nanus]|uniref:EKC/KEOPS complex subunit CGI121 n=1 Tax=Eeniella nana TaxID=13502 RepID=A0A875S444_EENNA|nr:uncharacterized protein FOA43_002489 [Brettanomyces nanus]QPG75145.1 hypothetical protein FOA43_002489 [Brettanomyces nanus]